MTDHELWTWPTLPEGRCEIVVHLHDDDAARAGDDAPVVTDDAQGTVEALCRRLVEDEVGRIDFTVIAPDGRRDRYWGDWRALVAYVLDRNMRQAVEQGLVADAGWGSVSFSAQFEPGGPRVGFQGGRIWDVYLCWPPTRPADEFDLDAAMTMDDWRPLRWLEVADDPVGFARRALDHWSEQVRPNLGTTPTP